MIVVKRGTQNSNVYDKVYSLPKILRKIKGVHSHNELPKTDENFIQQYEFFNARTITMNDAAEKYNIDEYDIIYGKVLRENAPNSITIKGVEYFNEAQMANWVENSPSLNSNQNP